MVRMVFMLLTLAMRFASSAGKYIEGELNTWENWAFLARFCFLSEQGQFEYFIEYDEDQGTPNILLYYDEDDQWPAVYKSSKHCQQREAVLRREQNQIVNLSTRYPYSEAAGCLVPPTVTTVRPKYTLIVPTLTTKLRRTSIVAVTTEGWSINTTIDEEQLSNGSSQSAEDMETTWTTSTVRTPIRKRSPLRRRARSKPRRVTCRNARRFRTARARWWFIAISNCRASRGIHVRYRMLMTNGESGDYWHEHFSADEFYVLPVLMAFAIAYSFLLLALVICSIELKSRQLLHSTYKLFALSVIIQFMGIVFKGMSYVKYAVNGVGAPSLKVVGNTLMGMSETCFLLLLLLLAKGYTVTRGRLPMSAGVKVTIFMCVYVVTYAALFIYEAKVFDPGDVLYTYESPAGYGLIVLRITAWCMFIYSTVFTLKHYPEKANFYYPFNVFGTLWFIAGPAFVISANTYVDKWVRESVVCAVLLFITFGGHLMFLLLTMPSVANKNFPYHVRTTQIGVMEQCGGIGDATLEQFTHHAYEPSASSAMTLREDEAQSRAASRQQRFTNEYGPSAPPQPRRDECMENVLSWSMAKNFNPLDPPRLDQRQLMELQEAGRRRRGSEAVASDIQDWIREVPVELFTVSRLLTHADPVNAATLATTKK